MSADPLSGNLGDPQSLNKLAYVLNNPTNLFDPFGLCTDETRNISCFETQARGSLSPLGSNATWFWLFAASGPGFGDFMRMIMGIPPSNSNSGTSTTTAEPPDPPKPPPGPPKPQECKTGISYGAAVSGAAEVGIYDINTAAQGSAGAGFASTSITSPASDTAYASGAIAGNNGQVYGGAPNQTSQPIVIGAYAGVGRGGFVSNASSGTSWRGPFTTYSANLFLVSIQFSTGKDGAGNGIWVAQATAGPGVGASVSRVTTYAVAADSGSRCR